jgi:hypothetical protein
MPKLMPRIVASLMVASLITDLAQATPMSGNLRSFRPWVTTQSASAILYQAEALQPLLDGAFPEKSITPWVWLSAGKLGRSFSSLALAGALLFSSPAFARPHKSPPPRIHHPSATHTRHPKPAHHASSRGRVHKPVRQNPPIPVLEPKITIHLYTFAEAQTELRKELDDYVAQHGVIEAHLVKGISLHSNTPVQNPNRRLSDIDQMIRNIWEKIPQDQIPSYIQKIAGLQKASESQPMGQALFAMSVLNHPLYLFAEENGTTVRFNDLPPGILGCTSGTLLFTTAGTPYVLISRTLVSQPIYATGVGLHELRHAKNFSRTRLTAVIREIRSIFDPARFNKDRLPRDEIEPFATTAEFYRSLGINFDFSHFDYRATAWENAYVGLSELAMILPTLFLSIWAMWAYFRRRSARVLQTLAPQRQRQLGRSS